MKNRALPLSVLLASLFLALPYASSHAASDWEKFEKAEAKLDWVKAAELIPKLDVGAVPVSGLQRFAHVYEMLGDKATHLRYQERIVVHKDFDGSLDDRVARVKELAAVADGLGQPGSEPIVAAYVLLLRGRGADAVAAMIAVQTEKPKSKVEYTAEKMLDKMIYGVFDDAYARKDWKTAAAMDQYLRWGPVDMYLLRFSEALEKAGNPRRAVRWAEKALQTQLDWIGTPLAYQGNPELVKAAAELDKRTGGGHASNPLVITWGKYMTGDVQTAITEMEQLALSYKEKGRTQENALAMFLCGDLWLEQRELDNALAWYHMATYFNLYYRQTGYNFGDKPQLDWAGTRLHRVLGSLRQARVLVAQGKPDVARREIAGLLASQYDAHEAIERNTELQASWNDLARSLGVTPAAMLEWKPVGPAHQPGDKVFDENGDVVPRVAPDEICADLRAKEKANWAAEAKDREETKLRAWAAALYAYLEEQRVAALPVKQRQPMVASAPEAPVKKLRRCASCLGTGKGNYVTGLKYRELDHTGNATGSPIDVRCSSCAGTGWR